MENPEVKKRFQSNQELANEYLKVSRPYCRDFEKCNEIAGIIREAEIDITEFFRQNLSLSGLKIRGIGKVTIGILEPILSQGGEKAGSDIVQQRIDEMYTQVVRVTNHAPGIKEDTSALYDQCAKKND